MLGFNAAIVIYNSYLPQISTEDRRDKISSRGFALGYLGGGLLLALNSVFIGVIAPRIGIAESMAVRISLLSAGVWWGSFALLTFSLLRSHNAARQLPPGKSYLTIGFSELRQTFPRAAATASHVPLPDRLSIFHRRRPDDYRHGRCFSGAGIVRRARP